MDLLKSISGSVTRWALTGVGAWLVSKGIVKAEDMELLIVGAGAALASLVWSIWQQWPASQNQPPTA